MLNRSRKNIKFAPCLDFRSLIVWGGFVCLSVMPGAFAAGAGGFDLGEAATGFGQDNVSNTGRTNVNFSDFGTSKTPNLNPQYNGSVPADLLPINQMNNTVQGENIYSGTAQGFYKPGVASGTYNQAPRVDPTQYGRQVNPYLPGSTSSLPPVTTGLQSQFLPNAFVPIAPSKYDFGFKPGLAQPYVGPYNGTAPAPQAGAAFQGGAWLLPNSLPTTSLGSVDLNVVGR